jgi:hypothetical protein
MLTILWESDAVEIDASPTQGFEKTAEVTDHAVERGSNISDHARPGNGTVTLEGFVSNTPITVPKTQMDGVGGSFRSVELQGGGNATVLQFDGPFDRVRRVKEKIDELINTSTIVEIHTGLEVLTDYLVTRFKVDRNAETGNALPFVLEAKRVRIVETLVERVPAPVERRGQPRRQRGNQPATTPPPESLAHRGLAAARSVLGL